jgi:uncharacterized protein (TIGR02421 family)
MTSTARPIDGSFVQAVAERYAAGKRVRRLLPGEGRLHIDRSLPFLCLHRRDGAEGSQADRLVTTQASYLVAGGPDAGVEEIGRLVAAIAARGAAAHGGFLVLEVWERPREDADGEADALPPPAFTVAAVPSDAIASTVRRLEAALERIEISERGASEVYRAAPDSVRERGVELVAPEITRREGCFWIGVGVRPIYRRPGPQAAEADGLYPMVLLQLERRLARALLETAHQFACAALDLEPAHPQVFGRRAVVRSAWNIDRRLVEVSDSFEFLRLSTPINEYQAWQEFSDRGFGQPPVFRYPPLPVDSEAIKRTLFNLPIERVEDPTLARLFREKQEELDKRISMLRDRGTPAYLYGSLQLYGPVPEELLWLAAQLLSRLPSHERDDEREGYLPADEVAALAEAEIDSYRARYADFPNRVELRGDIPPGMMVSHDRLLICSHSRLPSVRVAALLQHEVGTHLLTWCNGRAQRLRLLWAGLPGHDALQEGLAVLAEFLVGGLTRPRLRMLAARVVTCRALTAGATFVEAFDELVGAHAFAPRTAFTVVTRVYRSGGLTKDAMYLLGLTQILDYLGKGGRLEPLFVGKVSLGHLDALEELERRGVLRKAPLAPNYLQLEEARGRLARVREGMTVLDLVDAAGPAAA